MGVTPSRLATVGSEPNAINRRLVSDPECNGGGYAIITSQNAWGSEPEAGRLRGAGSGQAIMTP